MINLIGISGHLGSGKDTVAGLINDITGNLYEVKRFAGKLKQIASLLTGIPVEDFERQDVKNRTLGPDWTVFDSTPITTGTPVLPKYGHEVFTREMTVRELLQKLGTDAVRDRLHVNTWVNALFADYRWISEPRRYWVNGNTQRKVPPVFPNWIIPDTRFPNEFDAIKARGGIVIRVIRSKTVNSSTHPSETALDNHTFDYTIYNYGTLDDLRREVLRVLADTGLINKHRLCDGTVI